MLPEVFEQRGWVASEGWPFPFEALESDYAWANEVLQLGIFDFDAMRVGERVGHPSPFASDTLLSTLLWRFSPPTRFATRFADDLERDDLDVIVHAPLVRTTLRNGRVSSLDFARDADPNGVVAGEFTVEAGTYVFALGGIESLRQILLLARRYPEAGIDRSGWLGRGWMEHPHLTIGHLHGVRWDVDISLFDSRSDDAGTPVRAALGIAPEVREEMRLAATSVAIEAPQPLGDVSETDSGVAALSRALGLRGERRPLYARTEQRPHRQNRIELQEATDRFGQPLPRLLWRLHPEDIRDLRLTLSFLSERLGAAGMGFVRDSEAPSARSWVGGGNHHMGGLRMHESAGAGVVDPFGRVHAVPNLVIASSAVFPTGCFSNPTMTIVALASRFASRFTVGATS